MDIERFREISINLAQVREELLLAVALFAVRDNLAGGDIQTGEQGRGAVANLAMGNGLDIAQSHRCHRLGAIERLA
jgi:hypothetical protein